MLDQRNRYCSTVNLTILQKIEQIEFACINCNVSQFVTDDVTGEIVCSGCGCVLSENTEYRGIIHKAISDKQNSPRTGPGMSLKRHDKGLNTVIGIQNQDSTGTPLSTKNIQTFTRLRKWDSRSQTKNSADKSLKDALGELDKLQSKLGLSDIVIERASLFYRRASEHNLIRGRTVKDIAAACLYASCRDLDHARTLTEIAEQMHIKRKGIAKAYRSLFRELGFAVTIADPIKSISKIANKMDITEKTVRKAVHILDAAQDAGIVAGKNPEVMAGAILYAACVITGANKSQIEIAEASGTTTTSLRNRIREFKTKLSLFSTSN